MNYNPTETIVPVTLATLNKKGAFFSGHDGNGFVVNGWRLKITVAVFCGKVLDIKVNLKKTITSFNIICKEVGDNKSKARAICLDDGTGLHVFYDSTWNMGITKDTYVKVFGAIKPNQDGKI
jgi:hypothetical protein